jgi:hypothetical protein
MQRLIRRCGRGQELVEIGEDIADVRGDRRLPSAPARGHYCSIRHDRPLRLGECWSRPGRHQTLFGVSALARPRIDSSHNFTPIEINRTYCGISVGSGDVRQNSNSQNDRHAAALVLSDQYFRIG